MEKTFVAIKPDGVKRGLIGELITRFERKGYKIIGMKFLVPKKETVEEHYKEHVGKPFYPGLLKYLTSGPVVAMAVAGLNVVHGVRQIVGATNPDNADVGTIRADYSQLMSQNVIHASDSVESGAREIGIWFSEDEIFENWKTVSEILIEEQQN